MHIAHTPTHKSQSSPTNPNLLLCCKGTLQHRPHRNPKHPPTGYLHVLHSVERLIVINGAQTCRYSGADDKQESPDPRFQTRRAKDWRNRLTGLMLTLVLIVVRVFGINKIMRRVK